MTRSGLLWGYAHGAREIFEIEEEAVRRRRLLERSFVEQALVVDDALDTFERFFERRREQLRKIGEELRCILPVHADQTLGMNVGIEHLELDTALDEILREQE